MAASSEMSSKLLNVQCTYADCSKWFKTEKEMKTHKKTEPEHDYCKKCDVDCADWEDFVKHKVDMMQMGRNDRENGPAHIVCEFCGVDFKSWGGRDMHRAREHQAEQDITCPGCSSKFVRGSFLIRHIEDNKCVSITHEEYVDRVCYKQAQKNANQDQAAFTAGFQINKNYASSLEYLESEDFSNSADGGVPLMIFDDEDVTNHDSDTTSQLANGMEHMSLAGSSASSTAGRSTDSYETVLSRKTGLSANAWPSLPSTGILKKSISVASSTDTTSTKARTAWKGPVEHVSFREQHKAAKSTPTIPAAGDWSAWDGHLEFEILHSDAVTNVLQSWAWYPRSQTFEPERFRNAVNMYCCPFVKCGCEFDEPERLAEHIMALHLRAQWRCKSCLKIFERGSSLIAHAESAGGKCRVEDTQGYNKFLDEVSGGFLTSEKIKQPKVLQPGKHVVKAGTVLNGVMKTKYSETYDTVDGW